MFHIEPAHARQSVQAPLLSLNRSLDNLQFTIDFSIYLIFQFFYFEHRVTEIQRFSFTFHLSPLTFLAPSTGRVGEGLFSLAQRASRPFGLRFR